MHLQPVRVGLEEGLLLGLPHLEGKHGLSFQIQRVNAAEIDAGLGVLEGDRQHGGIQLLAHDGRGLVVDGGDILILGLGHAVFVRQLHLQGAVPAKDRLVRIFGGLLRGHVNIVQFDGEFARLQPARGLHGQVDRLEIGGVLDDQREVRPRGHVEKDRGVDEDKGDQVPEDAFHLLLFLRGRCSPPPGGTAVSAPVLGHRVGALPVNDKVSMLHTDSPFCV